MKHLHIQQTTGVPNQLAMSLKKTLHIKYMQYVDCSKYLYALTAIGKRYWCRLGLCTRRPHMYSETSMLEHYRLQAILYDTQKVMHNSIMLYIYTGVITTVRID